MTTLVVEDGSVVPGANAYLSLADADAYHALRGNAAWDALDDDTKEAALIKATDYMIQMYRPRWKGSRMDQNQVLDWPRGYVYLQPFIKGALFPFGTFPFMVPNDVVPDLVKNACAELALRVSAFDLLPDLTQGVERETIGPITVQYDKYSPQRRRYSAVDAMLAEFLSPGGDVSTRLVRT